MYQIRNTQILSILERTLNYVDTRLIDHGKRVSYLMYKVLKDEKKYTDKQLRDICILSTLHDIGAYKTEEIDRMVRFETEEIWEHSIFGYLYMREFSPISYLSPILMFHHAECSKLNKLDESFHEITQLLNIVDRMDVLYQTGVSKKKDLVNYLEGYRNITFCSKYLDYFLEKDVEYPASSYIDGDLEYNNLLNGIPFNNDEIDDYLWMIVFSIDFRSSYTVTHTFLTAFITHLIAEIMNYNGDEIIALKIAAMLHDIGKSGIPVEIIESPGKLTDEQMDIMKNHVMMTEHILSGNIDQQIKDIAIHHHEKLNGKGYPYNLSKSSLDQTENIVAIADILSSLISKRSYKDAWPKDKTLCTLEKMAEDGELDSGIVNTVAENYDDIIKRVKEESIYVYEKYDEMMKEYYELLESVENKDDFIIPGELTEK